MRTLLVHINHIYVYKYRAVIKLPGSIAPAVGVTLPVSYGTALMGLRHRAQLKEKCVVDEPSPSQGRTGGMGGGFLTVDTGGGVAF